MMKPIGRSLAHYSGFAVLVAGLWGISGPTAALAQDWVDLELVLAVDVSSSVSEDEYALQMRGLAEALRHPDVVDAVHAAGGSGVAVSIIQWSDKGEQALAVDWTIIRDAESAAALAKRVQRTPRRIVGGQTAIGGALRAALDHLDDNDIEGLRRVIDVSGDGRANSGVEPMRMRDEAIAAGVTVNGLAILNEEPFVDGYYLHSVIGGTGAFLMIAEDYEDFAAAMLEKLVREIGVPLAQSPTSPNQPMFVAGNTLGAASLPFVNVR